MAQRNPCDTCAFRKGCVTHEDEPHNLLKGEICVSGPLPFHCHHSDAGDWSFIESASLTPAEALDMRRELPICEGWRREVKAAADAGRYGHDPETRKIRRFVAIYALQKLREFLTLDYGNLKDEASRELELALRLLK